jgi:hypothetical protein
LITELIRDKISISSDNTNSELLDLIPREQLLKEYGGTAEKLVNYWPPFVPNRT